MEACAILCGGLATRLRPVTETIPKSLIEICGEPFAAHQLRLLRKSGIERVVLCAGYLGGMIAEFVGDGSRFGLEVRYSFDGDKPLGTGGAIRKALQLVAGQGDDSFFVLYGDSYLPCDYRAVGAAFRDSGRQGLMTIFRNSDSFDSSNVEAADGRITRYDKRDRTPAMQYIDYGLGVFDRAVFEGLPEGEHFDLAVIYQALLAKGELAAFEVAERFYEIGSLKGMEDLKRYLGCRS